MLHSMSENASCDRIGNVIFSESWGAPIVEKMVETRLRWFGHGWRRHVDSVVWEVYRMVGSLIARLEAEEGEKN